MKSNKNLNTNENSFEKQLEEIEEFQRHANDPGHWVGGKMPIGQKNLYSTPVYIIPLGIVMLVSGVVSFIHEVGSENGVFQTVLFSAFWMAFIVISLLLIIRGFKIIVNRRKGKF